MKFKSLFVVLVAGLICLPFMSFGEDLSVLRQKADREMLLRNALWETHISMELMSQKITKNQ